MSGSWTGKGMKKWECILCLTFGFFFFFGGLFALAGFVSKYLEYSYIIGMANSAIPYFGELISRLPEARQLMGYVQTGLSMSIFAVTLGGWCFFGGLNGLRYIGKGRKRK